MDTTRSPILTSFPPRVSRDSPYLRQYTGGKRSSIWTWAGAGAWLCAEDGDSEAGREDTATWRQGLGKDASVMAHWGRAEGGAPLWYKACVIEVARIEPSVEETLEGLDAPGGASRATPS